MKGVENEEMKQVEYTLNGKPDEVRGGFLIGDKTLISGLDGSIIPNGVYTIIRSKEWKNAESFIMNSDKENNKTSPVKDDSFKNERYEIKCVFYDGDEPEPFIIWDRQEEEVLSVDGRVRSFSSHDKANEYIKFMIRKGDRR